MRSVMAVALAVVLVLALVIPATPEPGAAASVAAADEDDDDDEVPVKRNTDSGQNATDENEGPRWRKPARPHEDSLKRPHHKPPSLRRRIGTQETSSAERVATPSELIRLIKQVSGNLSLSEWLQIHNLTLGDVLHGDRGVLTALTATPAPHTTPLPSTTTTTTTTSTEAAKTTINASDIVEATTISPRSRPRIPSIPRTTYRPRKLPTTSAAIMKKITEAKAQPSQTSAPLSPMAMNGMLGTALDPMMSPDQTDGHTSKPRRITSEHDDHHVDVESLDITTPRLTGALRAEIRAAAERFINAQVYSPGQIPDKYSTRAPPSIEPESADTKSGSPVTEAPSVHITRKAIGQRTANDSHNELEGHKRFMPPRRLFPFSRPRNATAARASPAQSALQLPPTRITFPLPEMIPVKTMIADAIQRGALPAPSTTPPATTPSPVVPGDEILDLLNSEESSKRLAKILESRNMTLSELLQLRERGSSQLHFSDFRPAKSTENQSDSAETVIPVALVPKALNTSDTEKRTNVNILQSFHEVPKYPFDSEEAASAGSAPAIVEAPRRSPRLLPDSAVVIPVPQEADIVPDEVDLADITNRFQFAGARAAIAVAAGVCGLAIAMFLSVFALCRWRQRRSMRRARSAILCEQLQRGSFRGRSLTPVLVNMSKSPVPYYSNKKDLSSRATSNTASNRHYYLWRSLRKAFQEDELQ